MISARDRRRLVATALLALGVPVGAAVVVGARTRTLSEHLSAAAGMPARIGAVDADLTGTVRLCDVALADLLAADTIEASVGIESLLAGELGMDELRVTGPRVAIDVDRDGDSELARVVRRLARGRGGGGSSSGGRRVRRIVVTSGALVARIAGVGELSADDVQLVPDPGGVRVLTGHVHLSAAAGRIGADLDLSRAAAELTLPHARFERALAVAGTGVVTIDGARAYALHALAIGRTVRGGPLELRAEIDDGGARRAVSASLAAGDLALALRGDRIPLAPLAPLVPRSLDVSSAHASGELVVRHPPSGFEVLAAGSLDDLRLDHPLLAPSPVTLSLSASGKLTSGREAIALADAKLSVGAAHVSASGWLRRGSPASGQLELRLDPLRCADLMAAVPLEVRGPLDGMVLDGSFGGRARVTVDLAAPAGDGVELDTALANGCSVSAEPPAADVGQLAGASEHAFPDGTHARVGKGEPGWTPLQGLPSYVSGAWVAAEDARFYDHRGFDPHEIARSLDVDLRDRRVARGGSTISQQLVKNELLSPRRTLDRKLQEMILTWRLEDKLDKHAILERYLNIIELGPHVFGLGAAARYWFDKAPKELTIRQAAFLAALTSEPTSAARRVRHAGGLDDDTAARVDTILRAMRKDGIIDKDQLGAAREAPMHFAAAALSGT